MYKRVIIFIFCWFVQSKSHEYCVNESSILWKSLDIWNVVDLHEKWYSHPVEELSQPCRTEFGTFLEGLSNGSAWAIKMLDASGHYSGGLFWGNEFWLGSQTLCRTMENTRSNQIPSIYLELGHEWRTYENRIVSEGDPLDIYSIPPFSIGFSVATIHIKFNSICQLSNATEPIVYVGLCLPRSCKVHDIQTVLQWSTDAVIKSTKIRVLNDAYYSMWNDSRFYILSSLFIIVILFMIAGTTFEICLAEKKTNNSWLRIINCFSIIGNIRSIFSMKVGEDTLSPIHGLKFISMLWVILVHTCLMTFHVAANKKYRDGAESDLFYQTISNGTFAVDTFLTLSGVLVSFLFFRTITKYPVGKLTGFDGSLGKLILYISMLVYRIIRLSLPYLVIVVLAGFLMELKVYKAPLPIPSDDHINCAQYWWRNALFINTFYPVGEMCMVWSWYLANDTQFYILGIPLLLLALNYRKTTLLLGILLLVSSWIITALISIQNDHIIDPRDPFANYDNLYDKPWTRVAPYLIGMTAGWFLYRLKCQLKLNKMVNYSLWIFSLSTLIFLVYSPVYLPKNPLFGALYTTLSHSAWSLVVSWVLIGCATGNGTWINQILSWRYMYPLSRLSYCAYLVHPLVIREVLLSSDSPFHLSVEIMSVLFFGFLFLSLVFAAILSLAFEAPMVALLRLAHPMRRVTQ